VKDLEASPSMTKITNAGVDYMNGLEVWNSTRIYYQKGNGSFGY
jgi:hypothetical protein